MKKAIWVWDSRYPFTQPLKFYNFLQDKEVDKVYLQINSTISYDTVPNLIHQAKLPRDSTIRTGWGPKLGK
jgi:hypothetical protein